MFNKYFNTWSLFEKLWLIISVSLLAIASYLWSSPWYGFVASISGIICVVLAAKGKISNYIWGIVNCVFYAYTAYTWKLYGEVMLNILYFFPMQFIGLYLWNKEDNKNSDGIKINSLSGLNRLNLSVLSIILVIAYKIFLESLGGNLTWVDSTSTVLSVIAMILMAKLYMEQWILWSIVDVVSIIMWVIVVFKQGSNDIGVLIMWSAFLINAIYGFVNWIKLYNRQNYND